MLNEKIFPVLFFDSNLCDSDISLDEEMYAIIQHMLQSTPKATEI